MKLAEYEGIKRRLREKYDRRIAALELIWEEEREAESVAVTVEPQEPPQRPPEPSSAAPPPFQKLKRQGFRKGSLVNKIKEAAALFPTVFTRKELMELMARRSGMLPKLGSTKAAFGRLVEDGFLEVVQQSTGRTPSTYRVKA